MKDIDSFDRKILKALVKDAKLSGNALSEIVGLSPSQCWQRVKRLEDAGVIRGYHAQLDIQELGVSEIVLVEISVDQNEHYSLKDVCERLAELPEVLEVYITSGGFDIFAKVAVASTREYERFLSERLYRLPHIRHSRSIFTLRCFKSESSFLPDAKTYS